MSFLSPKARQQLFFLLSLSIKVRDCAMIIRRGTEQLEGGHQQYRAHRINLFFATDSHQSAKEYINANDAITFCLDLMNKMRRNLINLQWNLIKCIQFDGFINDVMFYFYLVAVMVGITGLSGFRFQLFSEDDVICIPGYYDAIVVLIS